MSAEITELNCIGRLEELRKTAVKAQEFAGKDFNSMKSIMIQIRQNGLLTELDKTLVMLDLMLRIEARLENENN